MQGTAPWARWTEEDSGDPALAAVLANEAYGHPVPAESGLHMSSLTLLLQAPEPSYSLLLHETSENASEYSILILTT